jgi:HSP20 family protein
MQPAFSSVFENFFGRDTDEFFNLPRVGTGAPAVNVREYREAIRLEVAAPGLRKEDFKVILDNGLLTIAAERSREHEEKNEAGRYTQHEFSYQGFSRSFTLPNTVEADRIEARYQDGILHLDIPKREEARRKGPRQIAIV